MIDYKDVCAGPRECYLAAVYNLPAVGKCAALFVRKIIELSEVEKPEEEMHVIGFSLGGQLASQLAKYLKPIKLPRITGELQHIIIILLQRSQRYLFYTAVKKFHVHQSNG